MALIFGVYVYKSHLECTAYTFHIFPFFVERNLETLEDVWVQSFWILIIFSKSFASVFSFADKLLVVLSLYKDFSLGFTETPVLILFSLTVMQGTCTWYKRI